MKFRWSSRLRNLCPQGLRVHAKVLLTYLRLLPSYGYDLRRHARHSAMCGYRTQAQFDAAITQTFHTLEKGLAMATRRPGFGERNAMTLVCLLNRYLESGFPARGACFQAALGAMRDYLSVRRGDGTAIVPAIEHAWSSLSRHLSDTTGPATLNRSRQEVADTAALPFGDFCRGRHSVRHYSGEPVDKALIENAVDISRRSPSACNRQPARVYAIGDRRLIKRVLDLQGGSRGFGELADWLLLVTADTQAFGGARERNEPYVDGGMFGMTLLYALHHLQLGACPLNWCALPSADHQLRNMLPIPDSEVVIMMITVGHLPETFTVASSERKPLHEVLTVVPSTGGKTEREP